MSWLLFLDESGHDHKNMPYEVLGGIALHDRRVWPLIRSIADLEQACFGVRLAEFKKEFKGEKLLDKDRIEWAEQGDLQDEAERRRNARAFLTKGLQKLPPTKAEFTGYGQACKQMTQGIFRILRDNAAQIFAAAIPRGAKPSEHWTASEYLRKDHVFLLERFHRFVKGKQEQGLLVMDRVEDQSDIQFVRKLERYFTRTINGQQRSDWIVPAPFFSSSYLSVPIQVADVCIYCVNWGYRRPEWGMNAPVRQEIASDYGAWLASLMYSGRERVGDRYRTVCGIVYEANPYSSGKAAAQKKRRQNPSRRP